MVCLSSFSWSNGGNVKLKLCVIKAGFAFLSKMTSHSNKTLPCAADFILNNIRLRNYIENKFHTISTSQPMWPDFLSLHHSATLTFSQGYRGQTDRWGFARAPQTWETCIKPTSANTSRPSIFAGLVHPSHTPPPPSATEQLSQRYDRSQCNAILIVWMLRYTTAQQIERSD